MRKLGLLALVVVLLAALAVPAEAARSRADVRDWQEKLTLLGYDPGPIDGRFGPKTRSAVRSFQKDAGLSVDGVVGRRTKAALNDALETGGVGGVGKPYAANNQLDIYEDVLTDRLSSGSVDLPSRYAKVTLNRAGPGKFTVSVNGQTVSTSPGANALPRISHTFELPGEDVYIMASRSANPNCRLEHTVMSVRRDGTVMAPRPIGNCSEVLLARVQDDALVVAFPPKDVPSWRMEESWIYQQGNVGMR